MDDLLKDFSRIISGTETMEHASSGIYENDPYLKYTCYDLGIRLLKVWHKFYIEKLLTYNLMLLGNEDKVAIYQEVRSQFSDDSKYESLIKDLPDHSSDIDDVCNWLKKLLGVDKVLYYSATLIMAEKLEAIRDSATDVESSYFLKKLLELSKTFDLSPSEIKLITLYCIHETNSMVDDLLCREWNIRDFEKAKEVLKAYLGISVNEIRNLLSYKSKLCTLGIISLSKRSHNREMEFNNNILHFLNGINEAPITDHFYSHYDYNKQAPIELQDHLADQAESDLLLQLIRRSGGTNILFYGVPGTGKTEFAKSIAHHLGLDLYFIKMVEDANDSKSQGVSFRRMAIMAAMQILDHKKSLIVIDEADSLLNLEDTIYQSVEHTDKSWLNLLLENSEAKIIWISNQSRRIEQSTKRRFNFMMEFKDLNLEKRLQIWRNKCRHLGMDYLDERTLRNLAAKYNLNPGSISIALLDIKRLVAENLLQKEKIVSSLEGLLKVHQSFVSQEKPSLTPIGPAYFPELLNTSIRPERILKSLKLFRGNPVINNYNILFYGQPGTGKTEYAKFLARELGCNLITKRASDILSKYVGDCEKNIAAAFHEAERDNAILFLDECDSLFINRSSAERSYEVSRTNELLVAMENFRGILICSTNFKDGLDEAAGRRFTQKVYFDYLSKSSVREFFERFFNVQLSSDQVFKLEALANVTPGDFNVVKKRMIIEGVDSADELIELLAEETAHKKAGLRKVGL